MSFDDVIDDLSARDLHSALSAPASRGGQSVETLRSLQVEAALERNARTMSRLIPSPWQGMLDLVGRMGLGQISMLAAVSGGGKSTLVRSMVDSLIRQGCGVYILGLETQPDELRMDYAAMRLGIDPDILHTGRATLAQTTAVANELRAQARGDDGYDRLYFDPQPWVDMPALRRAAETAAREGCKMLVIDHIDHIDGQGNGHDASVRVNKGLKALATEYGDALHFFCTTQLNNEIARGNDRLSIYAPARKGDIYMGGHKEHISHWMWSLYRPICPPELYPGGVERWTEDVKAARKGSLSDPKQVLLPGCGALHLIKGRRAGGAVGSHFRLRLDRGLFRDWTTADDVWARAEMSRRSAPPSAPAPSPSTDSEPLPF